jgi:hypothetical protein
MEADGEPTGVFVLEPEPGREEQHLIQRPAQDETTTHDDLYLQYIPSGPVELPSATTYSTSFTSSRLFECRRLVQPGILCFAAVFNPLFIYYYLLFRRIGNLPNR